VVVRLTGDCPLHDAQVIDQVIQAHLDAQDKPVYTSNVHPPTFPDGLDVEVFPFSALEEAIHSAHDKHSREHVGPAIYKHYITDPALKPRTLNVAYPTDFSHLRWTLDTPEDYTFLNTVYEHLLASRPDFTWLDVVALLTRCPWMLKINADLERNFTVAQLKQDRQMALEKDRPQ
jgi:spore coat polysaccharide biosynthesis protein SpsF (cytidylyltransferase family)